jgi:hypothetical protein
MPDSDVAADQDHDDGKLHDDHQRRAAGAGFARIGDWFHCGHEPSNNIGASVALRARLWAHRDATKVGAVTNLIT